MAPRGDENIEQQHGSVWVVGGGIAGLATAAALRNIHGLTNVQVLEQRSADNFFHAQYAGAAAQLGPNGLRALRRIGGDELVQRIVADGDELTHVGVVVGTTGDDGKGDVLVIPDPSRKDTGLPQILIQWKLLRQHLQDMLPRESMHTSTGSNIRGCRTTTTAESGGTSLLTLVDEHGNSVAPFSDVEIAPPTLIVAAGKLVFGTLYTKGLLT